MRPSASYTPYPAWRRRDASRRRRRWLARSCAWAFVSAPDTRQTRSVSIQPGTLAPCWPSTPTAHVTSREALPTAGHRCTQTCSTPLSLRISKLPWPHPPPAWRVTAFPGSSRYDDGEMERGILPEHVKARAPASLCTHRILGCAPYAYLGRRWRRTRFAR